MSLTLSKGYKFLFFLIVSLVILSVIFLKNQGVSASRFCFLANPINSAPLKCSPPPKSTVITGSIISSNPSPASIAQIPDVSNVSTTPIVLPPTSSVVTESTKLSVNINSSTNSTGSNPNYSPIIKQTTPGSFKYGTTNSDSKNHQATYGRKLLSSLHTGVINSHTKRNWFQALLKFLHL